MREKKSKFDNVKEVFAATGVKISAPNLEKALAGMPLRSCSGKPEEIEKFKEEVRQEVEEVVIECDECDGVIIKADTIGGLEALRNLLQGKNIPISNASLGDINKKDLSKLDSIRAMDEFNAVILGFNIKIPVEIEEQVKSNNYKIITNDVIYRIIEEYEIYLGNLKKQLELKELSKLVKPCKFFILKGYTFRQSNPAIVGVEIEIGRIRSGDPIMNEQGKALTSVKSMKEGTENVNIAEQGKQLAMALDGVIVGRQINEGDYLYTDIPEEDFKKLKVLSKNLSKMEIQILKEIAEIKRKNNPVWGVG